MKRMILALVVGLLVFPIAVRAQEVPNSAEQVRLSFAPLVKKTAPAVVNIYAKRVVREQMRLISPFFNDPFFSQFFGGRGFSGPVHERVEKSLGSGVIVDAKGLVATNTHVISGATEIIAVTADGREYPAEKLLVDEKTDLAILDLDTKDEVLPFLQIADSDTLEVGDLVLAIGNPFGVGQTVTSGIISGLARTGVGVTDYSFFIQTDAAINPGNSGGALVDMQGRLIGINSMIFSRDGGSNGVGFAIPANMVKTVINASRTGGKLVRPWTGFSGQEVTSDMVESLGLKRAYGVLVNKVRAGSPAQKAGLRPGDVITGIDGKEVRDPDGLKFRFATLPLGSPVHLKVLRAGTAHDFVLETQAPPEIPPREETLVQGRNPLSGAVVANLSPAVVEEIGDVGTEEGVVIVKVETGSAARLGLGKGDVILAINGNEVREVSDLGDLLKAGSATRRWQIQVMRGGQAMNLLITI